MYGAEIHSQLIENILAGTRLKRPPTTSWLELLAFLLMATVLIVLLPRKGPGHGVMIFLAGTLLIWMASLVAFSQAKTLLDPSFPTFGNLLILGVLLTAGFAAANRLRRELDAALASERI